MSSKVKKIVWPINPYESSEKLEKNVIHFFDKFSRTNSIEIQPVSVMTSAFTQIMSYLKDVTYENLLRKATNDCEQYLRKFSQIPLLPVRLIENRVIFKSSEVKSFLDYLKENPCDFVCLSSYGKEKTQNIFLGSFAESYLRQSDHITFVIGPNTVSQGNTTKALVPVEATDESKDFVHEIISNANFSFLKTIKLFHKVTLEDYFSFNKNDLQFYGEKGLSKEDILKLAQKVALDTFSEFKKNTFVEDVSAMIVKTDLPIGKALVEEAEISDCGYIIMRSKTGAFLEAFVGSITKDVINASKVPVVVYPYHYKK
ncbi:MAG: universal stress protein [Bdellovibrionaceae bacterium]|nr:universal stress protein [Pseudobdellovibrionaceae bacterium]